MGPQITRAVKALGSSRLVSVTLRSVGVLLTLLILRSEPALAVNEDLCAAAGGPAECTGPETGPYRYYYVQHTWHSPYAFTTEEAAVAYLEAAAKDAYLGCTSTRHNPPFQPTPPGYGVATINIPDPAVSGGDNFTLSIYLGVEMIQRKWELRITGTARTDQTPPCTGGYSTGDVQFLRDRSVTCPAGYSPNPYTSPGASYCWRNPAIPVFTRRKNMGPCRDCDLQVANPVNVATGNKYAEERDYVGSGMFPLQYVRRYNSDAALEGSPAGPPYLQRSRMWRGTYDRAVLFSDHPSYPAADVYRQDGRVLRFRLVGTQWQSDADVIEQLTRTVDSFGNPTGWIIRTQDDELETYNDIGQLTAIQHRSGLQQLLEYDQQGRLVSVTHTFGQQLLFSYDADGYLISMTVPGSQSYTYGYGYYTAAEYRLTSATYPDGRTRGYRYENTTNPMGLTGITDELRTLRLTTTTAMVA